MKVTNYLLMVSDSGLLSVLVQLDFSAAFDTADHNIVFPYAVSFKGIACIFIAMQMIRNFIYS